MRRRALLATLGTATALTAGCLNRSNGGDPDETTTDDTPSGDPTTRTDRTTTGTPADPDSRFAGVECPSFEDTDRTVCFHTPGNGSSKVSVEPSTQVFAPATGDGTVETVTFVLHNRSGGTFGLNPHAWSLYRRTDDGWAFVAPDVYVEPWHTIEAGGTYTWHLSAQEHSAPMSEDATAIVRDLAEGTYAFQITGAGGDGPESGTSYECIALFDVRRGR